MSEEILKQEATTTVEPRKRAKKSKNPFVNYFVPFGLRQATDIVMLASVIVILVGLILHGMWLDNTVVIVGIIMYAVACIVAIFRCVLTSKDISKKSQEHKNAVINIVIMGIMLGLAILGILAAILW